MANESRPDDAVRLAEVHPTALVHPDAKLGHAVVVGPFSIVGPDVTIGDGTELGSNVVLENRVAIGRNNRIFHGAVLGTVPQDLKYEGADSTVVIGDDNTIREYATVNLATADGEETRIGSGCLLMAYTHVAHNCRLGDHVIMANSVNLAGHVTVDDWVILGGMTAAHQFVTLGAHSFIGGLSRISQDVPPFVKVAGTPPTLGGINGTGLERRGFSAEAIARIKEAYRLIYRRNLRVEEAVERIRAGGEDEISRTFEDFFSRSTRGIVR